MFVEKMSCEILPRDYPKISEVEELRSTYIANCVFNSFLSFTAIMLNMLTIHAIRKTSSLPKTLKTLLLSLAVSDVGVGLLSQPFYTSLLVKWLQQNNPDCKAYMMFTVIIIVFSTASFFGVVAVSVDRFLAIHLHLRYQELVTHKRVVVVVISIWLLSVFFSSMISWTAYDIYFLVDFLLGIVSLVLTAIVNIKIYLTVQLHKNQIQALQVQNVGQNGEVIANFARVIKSAVCVFYVYLVFLVCYVPFFISVAAETINGPSISLKRFSAFSWTLLFLNSSLNPLIYCWRMRHIRHAVMDILRNMPWFRNSETH